MNICQENRGVAARQALCLGDEGASGQTGKVAQVLALFGVPGRTSTVDEFLRGTLEPCPPGRGLGIFSSAATFLRLLDVLERQPEGERFWQQHVHSAFVWGEDDSEALAKLAARLTGGGTVSPGQIDQGVAELMVSEQPEDLCGVMAGIKASVSLAHPESGFVFDPSQTAASNIISGNAKGLFTKFERQKVAVFISTSKTIIDIRAPLDGRYFDVRNHFLSSVPLVLYVKWAFAETCWNPPETNACLVIDDPLLRPNYGFVNFEELLEQMKQHQYSTSIAFIPWNRCRSREKTVRLFKENPELYSLSIHGCDHTRREFGTSDSGLLAWKVKRALRWMEDHKERTGISHDRVMVFPQGVFSKEAVNALKQNNFIAAVNTEVISAASTSPQIDVASWWDMAVMDYENFPIFTRRYPSQGIENFAFDILLGKPCLLVVHHDFFRHGYAPMAEFVGRLNRLKRPMTWRTLAEVARRGHRQRQIAEGEIEIQMYGTEIRIENRSGRRTRFTVKKREGNSSAVKDISAESGPVNWTYEAGEITFSIVVEPGSSRSVCVISQEFSENAPSGAGIFYEVKVALRRYLSEIRDNLVSRFR
jgi:hypothetical protein